MLLYPQAFKILGGDPRLMGSTETALQVIREGLPVGMIDAASNALALAKSDLVPLIGANIRSLQRKKKNDHLTPQQSEHTLAIISVLTSATEYFDDQDVALTWMKTPQVIFGNKAAMDYLDTMTGIEFVNDVINRLKYGMTA